MDDILRILHSEFKIQHRHLEATIALLDEGNTIPFIARYRKEVTGSLDDQLLRELVDRLAYLRNLGEKRESYRALIEEQGKLTEDISTALDLAETLVALEDIYRAFRPKRRTRASIAKEKGLEPLAQEILAQEVSQPLEELAQPYVSGEVEDTQAAIEGALDIIAELISDDASYRDIIRRVFNESGVLVCKATDTGLQSVYEMYYDFREAVPKLAGHRVLAVNRGEKEGVLRVDIEVNTGEILNVLTTMIDKGNTYTSPVITATIEDAYKRLIAPSIEREIRNSLTEASEEGALRVFAQNLRQLLLQAPLKERVVLAIDPGFRTGCKICIVDGIGNVLYTGVVYPTHSEKRVEEARQELLGKIAEHGVNIIAIGNGTASRETEVFVAQILREAGLDIPYTIVNEAGASVYSASKLAAQEFPQFDVALRSAVSIGRRLQDPLAELVKIDPRSIGVGQYQHDMNQKRLTETLGGVVEACVNSVGVNLNTASSSLLGYVAGLSANVCANILQYREQNGKFKSRKQLLKVKGLGPKAFLQCAGFLRIPGGEDPLDATGVHPESYEHAHRLLTHVGISPSEAASKPLGLSRKELESLAKSFGVGVPTLADIVRELEKPGLDPREDMPGPVLRADILSMEDLQEGMLLRGVVRNIIDFGAFVDIGVHQDGLVHISQISKRFVKHPLEVVSIGDVVDVKVLGIDTAKKRISLSMKF